MWLREELTTDDDIMNKEFKSKVTVSSVGVNSAGIYKEDILNGADPVLADNLIPVTIDEKGKVTRADVNKKWYNYANQEWANAVILEDGATLPEVGQPISEDQIESYFVWIPKYSYQLWDLGEYDGLTEIDETKPHTIPIRFGTTNTTDKKGECATPMNSDNTQGLSGGKGQCKVGDYMTHPAFISFGVNGLWIGKFETGYKDAIKPADALVNPTDEEDAKSMINKVVIKSNEYSWRGLQVSRAYVISYNYERKLDSHLMKNTEWGAIAYLSHSIYGNEAIRINNNANYITGYFATEVPTLGWGANTAGNRQEAKNSNQDGEYTKNYFNSSSVVASTTNNYTGIYDMNGGAWEYAMGYTTQDTSLGEKNEMNEIYPNFFEDENYNKYYDKYSSRLETENNNRILGDATGELGPFAIGVDGENRQKYFSSWYNDYGYFVPSSNPWFSRGGYYKDGINGGIFDISRSTGIASNIISFRIVLAI